MPLTLTVSCFSKIQIGFTFLVPAHPGSPGSKAVKRSLLLLLLIILTYTHMECIVEYDGLRRRWAKSPIRDEHGPAASVARPNRAGGVDDLLLASCPFPVQLGNPRLLK